MDAPGFACGNKDRQPWVEGVYVETMGLQMPVGVPIKFSLQYLPLFAQVGNLPGQ
jgi:hypothetical protein